MKERHTVVTLMKPVSTFNCLISPLYSYDLIGGNALSWTEKDPPHPDEAMKLKEVSEEGSKTLQEIQLLMAVKEEQDEPPSPVKQTSPAKQPSPVEQPSPVKRSSRRKQAKVLDDVKEDAADEEEAGLDGVAAELDDVVEALNKGDEEYVPEMDEPQDDDDALSIDNEVKTRSKTQTSPPKVFVTIYIYFVIN